MTSCQMLKVAGMLNASRLAKSVFRKPVVYARNAAGMKFPLRHEGYMDLRRMGLGARPQFTALTDIPGMTVRHSTLYGGDLTRNGLTMPKILPVEQWSQMQKMSATLLRNAGRLENAVFRKPTVTLRGPLGQLFKARHDGYFDFRTLNQGTIPSFTALEDIPGIAMRHSSFLGRSLEGKGFQQPRILPFDKWHMMKQSVFAKQAGINMKGTLFTRNLTKGLDRAHPGASVMNKVDAGNFLLAQFTPGGGSVSLGAARPGMKTVVVNPNLRMFSRMAGQSPRKTLAHEAFHARYPGFIGGSETLAHFAGGFHQDRKANLLQRLSSGTRDVVDFWNNLGPKLYPDSPSVRFMNLFRKPL